MNQTQRKIIILQINNFLFVNSNKSLRYFDIKLIFNMSDLININNIINKMAKNIK